MFRFYLLGRANLALLRWPCQARPCSAFARMVAGLLHHVDSADEENLSDSYATACCVVHMVLLNILVMPTSVNTEM